MLFRTANLLQLDQFDEIIDVRTPAEFAEDHIPGAINCPVLSNEERVTVGTLYKQVSPFEARKVGAALIANNIAHHLQTRFRDYLPHLYGAAHYTVVDDVARLPYRVADIYRRLTH